MRSLDEIHQSLIADIHFAEDDVPLIVGDELTEAGEVYLQSRIDNEADWLTAEFAYPAVGEPEKDDQCTAMKWYAENHGAQCILDRDHQLDTDTEDHDFGEDE